MCSNLGAIHKVRTQKICQVLTLPPPCTQCVRIGLDPPPPPVRTYAILMDI